MLVEEWKDIKGYEGLYRISNYGNVLGVKRNKILKKYTSNNQQGCERIVVCLTKNGVSKNFLLSRLVYSNFTGDIKGMIDFKDGDYNNCSVDNLIDVNKTFKFKNKHCCKVLDTKSMKIYDSMSDLSKEIGISHIWIGKAIRSNFPKYSHYKIIENV